MKKELIVVITILIIAVLVNFFVDRYTDRSISSLNTKLEAVANMANEINSENGEQDTVVTDFKNVSEEWEKVKSKMAFYIEHDELEKVSTSIVAIEEFLKLGSYDDAIPEIKKCMFILEHIKEKQSFSIINLF